MTKCCSLQSMRLKLFSLFYTISKNSEQTLESFPYKWSFIDYVIQLLLFFDHMLNHSWLCFDKPYTDHLPNRVCNSYILLTTFQPLSWAALRAWLGAIMEVSTQELIQTILTKHTRSGFSSSASS